VYEVNGNKTDPFNKMVDDVRRRKYDIAVAPIRCVSERAQIVDYTYLMHRSKYVPSVAFFTKTSARKASKPLLGQLPLHIIATSFVKGNLVAFPKMFNGLH
jgi:hypothetical protein